MHVVGKAIQFKALVKQTLVHQAAALLLVFNVARYNTKNKKESEKKNERLWEKPWQEAMTEWLLGDQELVKVLQSQPLLRNFDCWVQRDYTALQRKRVPSRLRKDR